MSPTPKDLSQIDARTSRFASHMNMEFTKIPKYFGIIHLCSPHYECLFNTHAHAHVHTHTHTHTIETRDEQPLDTQYSRPCRTRQGKIKTEEKFTCHMPKIVYPASL